MPAKDRNGSLLGGYKGEIIFSSCAVNILSLALPVAILQVYDRVIPLHSGNTLLVFVFSLCVVLLLDMCLSLGRSWITGWMGARLQHQIAVSSVDHLFHSDLRAFEAIPAGVHLQRLKAVDSVKNFFAGQGLLLLVDLPFAAIFFLLIGMIAGSLVFVPLALVLLLGLFAQASGRQAAAAQGMRKKTDDSRYNFMIEVLSSIHTVKGLGMESMMTRRYERLQATSAEASYAVAEAGTWARNSGQMFAQIVAVSVGAYGATLVIGGTLSIGGLAACVLLASRSAQPIMRALGLWTQFQNARLARNQIDAVAEMPRESEAGAPALHRIKGNVRLETVSFGYTSPGEPLFRDLEFRLDAGETVAVTGDNGSGKSTLLGLVTGLLVPDSGRVLIDGRNVWSHDATSLRRQVIYLPQKPALFQGTLLENITMFRGDNHVDAALAMADRLGLHEAVGRMPHGYDTRIEHAANDGLPGGIRQRIALVRALTLVDDPQLILFDEANTFLDQKSDQKLLDLLREYRERCTMIVVSHRPSYLALAERSFVIRNKRLEEAAPGVRASLDRLQREFA